MLPISFMLFPWRGEVTDELPLSWMKQLIVFAFFAYLGNSKRLVHDSKLLFILPGPKSSGY